MALEITYWTASGNKNMPGSVISSETRSLSGTSAQSGATPANADIVSISASEAARFVYSLDPTASATSAYIAAGERLWIDARSAYKVAGITA